MCMGSHWFQPLTGFGNQYNCFTYTEPLKNHFLRPPLMSLFAKYCTSNHRGDDNTIHTWGYNTGGDRNSGYAGVTA